MISARESLARLQAGNRRFVAEVQSRASRPTEARRLEVAAGQEPFAIILGCSDSRVPAEIVFDQGLGDLFVIRVAGNIVAASQVGQRGVRRRARYGTRLVVVLGHSQCGAILATLEELQQPHASQSREPRSIVDRVRPGGRGAAGHRRCGTTRPRSSSQCGARQHPRLGQSSAPRVGGPGAADRSVKACWWWAPSTRWRRGRSSTSSTGCRRRRTGEEAGLPGRAGGRDGGAGGVERRWMSSSGRPTG